MERTAELAPVVVAVDGDSAAARAGIVTGDQIVSVDGKVPRDVLEWQQMVDGNEVDLVVLRGGLETEITVSRTVGEALGITVSSAVFDRVQTCDNHCEFCFIYQLPKGLRRSLYTKDDDYRLSFLFGNFTTLTRFTEADLERVVDERLSPLYVSVHAVDPQVRAAMLRNERGGVSLRWLRAMLNHGIEANVQIVLCPGVNDRMVLDDTLLGLLEQFPEVSSVAVVPLGLSRHNTEARMRVHTAHEAEAALDAVERWAARFRVLLGRSVVYAADELYLRAGREIPGPAHYGAYPMMEDGIGLVRSFVEGFEGRRDDRSHHDGGFFASVDTSAYVRSANPAVETGLRSGQGMSVTVTLSRRAQRSQVSRFRQVRVLTGALAAPVIDALIEPWASDGAGVQVVDNHFFGGNTAVAGLMTFEDILRATAGDMGDTLHLIPGCCLNGELFLDGHTLGELAEHINVEVVPASGTALRERLEQFAGERA